MKMLIEARIRKVKFEEKNRTISDKMYETNGNKRMAGKNRRKTFYEKNGISVIEVQRVRRMGQTIKDGVTKRQKCKGKNK